MPTVLNWPVRGEWLLANPKSPFGRNAGGFYRKVSPPFAVLMVHFKSKTGTIRVLQNTVPIANVRLRQTADGPKFSAPYAIGAHSGTFEATVLAKYELEIEFTGTATTSVNAHPMSIDGADTDVASLSVQDKFQEAIRRALPLMPQEVRHEVEAMFTPAAVAVMAGMAALWLASQSNVIGWAADLAGLALLLTAGVLLGRVAFEVGTDLAEFMVKAAGAGSQQDLNEAAEHFAAAVLKGGVLLVGTILLNKGGGKGSARAKATTRPEAAPAEPAVVPPERIPLASRGAAAAAQGEQPQLAGIAQELQQTVRNLLNHIRRNDVGGKGIDCAEGCEMLQKAAGGKGTVVEGTSGASSPARVSDHTMWEIGGQWVDTRPGWWREIFRRDPAARAAVDRAVPGLAERLENGAVLTAEEHARFQSGSATARPRGPRPGG